jgi:hypothetical protein
MTKVRVYSLGSLRSLESLGNLRRLRSLGSLFRLTLGKAQSRTTSKQSGKSERFARAEGD